jgi:hypothetical protein
MAAHMMRRSSLAETTQRGAQSRHATIYGRCVTHVSSSACSAVLIYCLDFSPFSLCAGRFPLFAREWLLIVRHVCACTRNNSFFGHARWTKNLLELLEHEFISCEINGKARALLMVNRLYICYNNTENIFAIDHQEILHPGSGGAHLVS